MTALQNISGLQLAAVDDSSSGGINWDKAAPSSLSASSSQEGTVLTLKHQTTGSLQVQCHLGRNTLWRATGSLFFLNPFPAQSVHTCFAIRTTSTEAAEALQRLTESASSNSMTASVGAANGTSDGHAAAVNGKGSTVQQQCIANGGGPMTQGNHFDAKTDKGSSDMYFHYYGMIMHQQNMLQDYHRTGTYYQAIVCNRPDFEGKVVMDVGAGSGILSLFAAQAGARKVYAVEASGMAQFARQLADANPALGSRVEVINMKVEQVAIPEKVDVLVSEPMGTLLVNERMIETYLYARDHFLKPGGKMFPQIGRIHAAAFSDEVLHAEVASKAAFWLQNNFYGIDVTSLYHSAVDSYFAQVVVDAFDPGLLVSTCATRVFDFATLPEGALLDIEVPLSLQVTGPIPLTVHGVATWFDVFFNGAACPTWLSTAPGLATTHWFQLRCVFQKPLFIMSSDAVLKGTLRLVAHARQSYDVHVTLSAPPLQPGMPPQVSSGKFDLKEPYYRQLQPAAAPATTTATAAVAAWPVMQQAPSMH